ncbi:MAG: NAD(P)-dependent oxidoreductase [Bacteroides sp.]|nr:NAD(P)-dependent oxidoreductase [Bacteroides sp.]
MSLQRENKNILVTGASGFIGSFLVEGALERGMQVWAGVRKSSSRKYLQDDRIRFAELDFGNKDKLKEQLSVHKQEHNGWDAVIHCAGVTKCKNREDFDKGNYQATVNLVEALKELDMVPQHFIYISSLSIFGPIHEDTYQPISEADEAQPNTAYGVSKLKSEKYLQALEGFPYVIYRPTGVYGPRERDYFLMAKSIKQHIDFAPGFKRQDLTFIYVKDLVQAVYLSIEKNVTRRAYFVSDGQVYSARSFSDLIQKELGNPWVIHIKCPLIVLKVVSLLAETVAGWFGKASTLNGDKYNIMKQRNWQCDITPLIKELGYQPEYLLDRGVKEIIAWYKKEKWL